MWHFRFWIVAEIPNKSVHLKNRQTDMDKWGNPAIKIMGGGRPGSLIKIRSKCTFLLKYRINVSSVYITVITEKYMEKCSGSHEIFSHSQNYAFKKNTMHTSILMRLSRYSFLCRSRAIVWFLHGWAWMTQKIYTCSKDGSIICRSKKILIMLYPVLNRLVFVRVLKKFDIWILILKII